MSSRRLFLLASPLLLDSRVFGQAVAVMERPWSAINPQQLAVHFDKYRTTLRVAEGKLIQSAEAALVEGKPGLVSGWDNPAVRTAGSLQRYAGTITAHDFGDVFVLDSGVAVELTGVREVKPGLRVEGWGKAEGSQALVSRPAQNMPKVRRVSLRPATLVDLQTLGRTTDGLLLLLPSTDICSACQGSGKYEKRGELKKLCATCGGSGKNPRPQVVRTKAS